ncbi:MAG TPA: hypothetical protein VN041_05195, partial [Microbacterium sp.]|nr:hypothetical protein [Microbacterium sp.]
RPPARGQFCLGINCVPDADRYADHGSAVNLLVRADGIPLRVRVEISELSADEIPREGEQLSFAVAPARAVVISQQKQQSESEYLTVATNAIVSPR